MLLVTLVYLRQMLRIGERALSSQAPAAPLPAAPTVRAVERSDAAPGRLERAQPARLLVFAVMVFPVYWMVSTAFKPASDILTLHTEVVPDLRRSTISATRSTGRIFWCVVKNSVIVVVRRDRALARARVPGGAGAGEVPFLRRRARSSS